MFRINNDGIKISGYAKKEFYKSFLLEPLIYSILLLLFYFSVGTKSILLYWIITCITILYYLIFGVYAQIKFMKKINRTISQIDFFENSIFLKTDKLLWLNAKKYNVQKNNLQIKNRTFEWYSVKGTKKEGMSITINGTELYLVKDYFDKYDEIFKILNAK